jgi:hypothetical protein
MSDATRKRTMKSMDWRLMWAILDNEYVVLGTHGKSSSTILKRKDAATYLRKVASYIAGADYSDFAREKTYE